MYRLIIRILPLFLLLLAFPVFANDASSIFSQQGYITYSEPEPINETSFFATKAPMPSKGSWYFGINIGGSYANLKPDVEMYQSGTLLGKLDAKRNAFGLDLGPYFGYGVNLRHFYIAGELSAFYSFLSRKVGGKIGSNQLEISIKKPATVAFDILPGYLTDHGGVIFYGRLGVGTSLVRLKLSDITNKLDDSSTKFKLNYRLGLGVEFFASETFGWRIEYLYTHFKKNDGQTYSEGIYKYIYGLGNTKTHTVNLGLSIHI